MQKVANQNKNQSKSELYNRSASWCNYIWSS